MIKVQTQKQEVVLIYYYYNPSPTPVDAYKDMANPAIVSIITFRKWDKQSRIQILDCSDTEHNWGDWPQFLNVEIVRSKTYKIPVIVNKNQFQVGMLGKIPVLFEHVSKNLQHHSTIVVVDADIFFVKDPFPLSVDHSNGLCCSTQNTGYFYFTNPWLEGEMNEAYKILELWAGLCAGALVDDHFAERVKARCNVPYIQEEVIFWYLQKTVPGLLIKDIPYTENFWFDWPTRSHDMSQVKNLHYRVWKTQAKINRLERGKIALCVKEIRRIIFESLDQQRIYELWEGWDYEQPFSICDSVSMDAFVGNW